MSGHDVLIVGAGPTGLTLALALARAGVSFRIIDKSAVPAEESRALAIHARSLEIFSQLGVARSFLQEGRRVAGVRFFVRGRAVGSLRLDDIESFGSAFPFILNLEQRTTEQILLAKLKELGVAVERSTELVSLHSEPEGARVTLARRDAPHGAERKRLRRSQIDYAASPPRSQPDPTNAPKS
ncbi:MAG: FAD-dependent monooxygenase, partial [Candidatus Sumerlaeia bacterium]|nr:FAD-dependent monooxygenase [Candidatus Sumerlaeia bacterium]